MKILILKPSSLGDVVQALPVLRLLKRHDPTHEIHWWISSDLVGLLRDDPDLSGTILFNRRRWQSPWHWPEALRSVREVRALRFDWVIDLQGLLRSAVFAWLARGALTVGLLDPREGAPAFYDYAVARPSPDTHAADWYLRVLTQLEVPVRSDFEWLPARPEVRLRLLAQRPPGPLVVLHPGARWLNKRWPLEHFQELVRRVLRSRPDARFTVLGGAADSPLARALVDTAPQAVFDLTGHTTLPEMVEWIRLADLVITNDTGPMHVAAALRKRVIALFGPTDPCRTGPYGMRSSVLQANLPCVPCMRSSCCHTRPLACLWEVGPDRVAAVAARRLAEVPAGQTDASSANGTGLTLTAA